MAPRASSSVGREVTGINHTVRTGPVAFGSRDAVPADVDRFGRQRGRVPCKVSTSPLLGCSRRVGALLRERKLLNLEDAVHRLRQLPARRLAGPTAALSRRAKWV